jgi:hypothetical protein
MSELPERVISVDAFLEAHHYDGGLRTVPLGRGGARPDWAPHAERVGFRDEFVLTDRDQAIEFYRVRHQGRKLTWLAVYRRSVDRSYGDRRNHAGVGVWLIDQMVVEPRKLLKGLSVMAEAVSQNGPLDLESDAAHFLSGFLPKYLLAMDSVPAALQGWEFNSPEQAQTQTFVAPVGTPDQPFEHVAGQIAAMSWLPGPAPQFSRAVILLREGSGDMPAGGRFTPEPVDRDPLPAILRQIPLAMESDHRESGRLREQLDEAAARHENLSRRLDAGKTAFDSLSAQSEALQAEKAELQRQIESSDPLKMLNRICTDLDVIRRQTAGLDHQLPAIERVLRHRPLESGFALGGPAAPPAAAPRPVETRTRRGWSRSDTAVAVIVTLCLAIAGAALLYFKPWA